MRYEPKANFCMFSFRLDQRAAILESIHAIGTLNILRIPDTSYSTSCPFNDPIISNIPQQLRNGKQCVFSHWRSSHYAVTHVRNKIVTLQDGKSDFVYLKELLLK